ncbi:MAG: A24 family peptidase [Moraxella sp.]|nr:A24 family peptidase [Moraxella sp.]
MMLFGELFTLLQQSPATAMVIVAILGLCVGSFLNVVIHRTPLIMHKEWRHESAHFWQDEPDLAQSHKDALLHTIQHDTPLTLSFPPSRCPTCNHQIRWFENIPVISWLALKGKCSCCNTPISIRYPLVEITTALLSVFVIALLGITTQGVAALVFTWILVALTGIDFDTQLLPDRLVYPLGMIGLAVNTQSLFVSPTSAIWGGILGFLSLWSVATLYSLLMKKQGMGHGDFKLLAALGAWLGASMLPLIILLSSLIGAIIGVILMRVHGSSKPFAFGPYIAMAGMIALLFGQDILGWYLGQFNPS